MHEDVPDFDELDATLHVVGTSARLEILHQLRLPSSIADLRIAARTGSEGRPATLMARQSVAEHVQKLVDLGVVRSASPAGESGPREYIVNAPRFYQIVEDLRSVGSMLAARSAASMDFTVAQDRAAPKAEPRRGPHLVVVHGLFEGKSFALEKAKRGTEWWIGRGAESAVALDYDPYVSVRNSVISREGTSWRIRDSGSSRNGTHVDWTAVDAVEGAPLRPGSVVGVGRSLLVFQDDGSP
ncbi:MAG TPA: FHA domain-containing protein [Candidatus Thermoplasmatota archaeon]|nr:FHA domain-containing protein [Candidatus Thermoplasmatota archaeon]